MKQVYVQIKGVIFLIKVFVYGTLRKGEKNDHLLQKAINLEQQCWTYGILYDTGEGYPALIPSTENKTVGELYQVTESELFLLDELEEYIEGRPNNLYNRIIQEIYTKNSSIPAYVYEANDESLLKIIIPDGDWVNYRRRSLKNFRSSDDSIHTRT